MDMTSCERVHRCLEFRTPDRAPRDLWCLPWVGQFARPQLDEFLARVEMDFTGVSALAPGDRASGRREVKGTSIDDWGSVWTVAEDGVVGEVTGPAIAEWSALTHYQPPWETVRRGDWDGAKRACEAHRKGDRKFIRCGTSIRTFERLQFLRGSETLYLDLGEESPEFFKLIGMLHEFFLEELSRWVELDCDALQFMDDWGGQKSMLISPSQWRRIFKPLYRDYCKMIHDAGKKVFFHSDGYIVDIYEDLIEVGVDALNSQLFSMDIEEIGRQFKGRMTFWGEIDRQHVLPFGTAADVYKAVARVRKALDEGRGGVIAQCEWGVNNPPENIAAVYEAWAMPLPELLAKVSP